MFEFSQETVNGFFAASIAITGIICMTVIVAKMLSRGNDK